MFSQKFQKIPKNSKNTPKNPQKIENIRKITENTSKMTVFHIFFFNKSRWTQVNYTEKGLYLCVCCGFLILLEIHLGFTFTKNIEI